jgi:prepilin-type N-terminal cleavage/methylation domain-containing protein
MIPVNCFAEICHNGGASILELTDFWGFCHMVLELHQACLDKVYTEDSRYMKNNDGFSLLELLIVVAIILIIATIAIPSLLRSRQAANESAAVANLRNLNTAEVGYSSTHAGVYGSMTDLVTAGLLDDRYLSQMSGYDIRIELSANALDYTAGAAAHGSNDGRFDYYSTPDYVIRYSTLAARAPAGLTGQPVR